MAFVPKKNSQLSVHNFYIVMLPIHGNEISISIRAALKTLISNVDAYQNAQIPLALNRHQMHFQFAKYCTLLRRFISEKNLINGAYCCAMLCILSHLIGIGVREEIKEIKCQLFNSRFVLPYKVEVNPNLTAKCIKRNMYPKNNNPPRDANIIN
jgi:hypothetical protein